MAKPMRDAFAERKERFRLLDKGICKTGWTAAAHLLEVGCAAGEAAFHVAERFGANVTGVDFDAAAIAAAGQNRTTENCVFLCADARSLPFENNSFDGIYSEAAFAPLDEKEQAAAEYARVLRPGAMLLINDFAVQSMPLDGERDGVSAIPCFRGVQTMERYREIFQAQGFSPVSLQEDYQELIQIVLRMSTIYGVRPDRIGEYLVREFGAAASADGGKKFFSSVKMTYCQMIFQRSEGTRNGQ